MPAMRTAAVAALALVACVDMDEGGSSIVGTSGDVQTEPGTYVGYRVVSPCEARHVNIGLVGMGSVELTDVADITAAGQEMAASMRDIASIWGYGGYGLACEAGVGTQFYSNNWQDVDTIIARVGQYLRDHDYTMQVGISVSGIPVPHAD